MKCLKSVSLVCKFASFSLHAPHHSAFIALIAIINDPRNCESPRYSLNLLYFFGCCVLDHSHGQELLPLSPRACSLSLDPLGRLLSAGERPKRTGADYRALWKTAIHQQILLLRMEKENQRLEGELSRRKESRDLTAGTYPSAHMNKNWKGVTSTV